MAVPKKKTSKAKSRSRRASNWVLDIPARSDVPPVPSRQGPSRRVPELRLVQGPPGGRDRLMAGPRPASDSATAGLPVAVDAMGGDRAPGEIVAGARQAADELGIPVVLVGRPEELGDTGDLEVLAASEVIAMDDDPGQSVRRKKDSSLVRCAEAVRDGKACAMVSAGNTGAAMASALLRMGRIKGITRPAIATPIPVPGIAPDGAARRRRQRRVHGRHAGAVRPDGRALRHGPLRRGRPVGRPALDRRGEARRATRSSKRPTRCWPSSTASASSATSKAATCCTGPPTWS